MPADALLPGAVGLGTALRCLTEARFGIIFGVVGAAMACYETALAYAKQRVQFGKPIATFQLTQQKLVDMLTGITQGQLLAVQLGRLKAAGRLRHQQVSLGQADERGDGAGRSADGAVHAGRQRHSPPLWRDAPRRQLGNGVYLRGHARDTHAGGRAGRHGNAGVCLR